MALYLAGRRRPADALAQEPAGQQPDAGTHRHRLGLAGASRTSLRASSRELAARARAQLGDARAARAGGPAGALRRRRARARPAGAGGARGRPRWPRASARSASSWSRSPPPSTTSAACDREAVVLIVDVGGGTSDFTVVRLGPRAARPAQPRGRHPGHHRRPHRRHRLRPQAEPCAGDAAAGPGPRRPGRPRRAQRHLPRPGHLAPDQLPVRAAAGSPKRGRCARTTPTRACTTG